MSTTTSKRFPTPHPQRSIRYLRTESPEPFGSPEVEEQLDMIDTGSGVIAGPELTVALVLDGAISADGKVLFELRGKRAVGAYDMETGARLESFPTETGDLIPISSFCDLRGTRLLGRELERREAMGPVWDRVEQEGHGDELLRVHIRAARTASRGGRRRIVVLEVTVQEVLRSGGLAVGDELEVRCLEPEKSYLWPNRYVPGAELDAVLVRATPGSPDWSAMLIPEEEKETTEHRVEGPGEQPDFYVGAAGEESLANFGKVYENQPRFR